MNDNKTTRKASDVILDLELKVNKAVSYISSMDHNIKLLINKINELIKLLKSSPNIENNIVDNDKPSSNIEQPASKPLMPGLKSNVVKTGDGKLVRTEINRHNKKTSIKQKLYYSDGKAISMAKIEILDLKGNVVEQTKSNNGQWFCSLLPGKYLVNILKHQTSTKPEVNISFEVEVPKSDNVLELDSPKIK